MEALKVEIVEEELGRVLNLTTTMTRPTYALTQNVLTGVVTFRASDGEIAQGQVLYTVGETNVRAVEGEIPFWRDLGPGIEGPDVKQLQALLNDEGIAVANDGKWDEATTAGVKAWQDKRGLSVTGIITFGEFIAVPELPASISLDPDLTRPGVHLNGGEDLVFSAAGAPSFEMELTPGQAEMIPGGTTVEVSGSNIQFDGITGEATIRDDGFATIEVFAPDGGSLCGDNCHLLPAGESNYLPTVVEVAPPVIGPVVPVSALKTDASGSAFLEVVTSKDGGEVTAERKIEVLIIVDGLAAIAGAEAGEQVKLFPTSSTD